MELFNPVFWEKAWEKAEQEDKARPRGGRAVEVWNRRAKSYDKNVSTDSGQERVHSAIEFLNTYGVLKKELRILDIGCGPGNFAAAFAKCGHTVYALDPAEKMIAMLNEKIAGQPELQKRIKPVCADWTVLDVGEYGWDGYFDLVFASMTPGVHNVATLRKAMQVSARWVFLSRFAGPRLLPSLSAIWRKLYDSEYYNYSADIIFPFNWLYAGGYRPVAHYSRWEREHRQHKEEAVQEIIDILSLRTEVDGLVEGAVREYVEKFAVDGLITEKKGATAAMLLWRVDKEIF